VGFVGLYISGVCFALFLCVKKLKTRTQNTAKHKTPQNKHRKTFFFQNTVLLLLFFKKRKKTSTKHINIKTPAK